MAILSLLVSFLFPLFAVEAARFRSQSPEGVLINCGATAESVIDGRRWVPDTGFFPGGVPKKVENPRILPTLQTARSFPRADGRKFCYTLNVFRGKRYLVRTTYFYGGINGGGPDSRPPVFDQMVDGTFWSVVNTTEEYAQGMVSFYEGVFRASGKYMMVCVGANTYTDSDPFISTLELVMLEDSMYNATDFKKFALSLYSRNSFGYTGPSIRYPDDRFDRIWEPFGDGNNVLSNREIPPSRIWNRPPSKIFNTGLAQQQVVPMEIQWPPGPLPKSSYYVALYFADGRNGSTQSSRVFDVSINGAAYYSNLHADPAGNVIYSSQWPLAGITKITLTPDKASEVGPVINAGEIFYLVPVGGNTKARDVVALRNLKNSLRNPPVDWIGDPCLPRQYSWTGVTCSHGDQVRVVNLNLTSANLSGSLSSSIAKLSALSGILLGNNSLSGTIPDLSSLKQLQVLHLEGNQFTGELPSSLGDNPRLREVFLQGNRLSGQVPESLKGKPGLTVKTNPGNHFSRPRSFKAKEKKDTQ